MDEHFVEEDILIQSLNLFTCLLRLTIVDKIPPLPETEPLSPPPYHSYLITSVLDDMVEILSGISFARGLPFHESLNGLMVADAPLSDSEAGSWVGTSEIDPSDASPPSASDSTEKPPETRPVDTSKKTLKKGQFTVLSALGLQSKELGNKPEGIKVDTKSEVKTELPSSPMPKKQAKNVILTALGAHSLKFGALPAAARSASSLQLEKKASLLFLDALLGFLCAFIRALSSTLSSQSIFYVRDTEPVRTPSQALSQALSLTLSPPSIIWRLPRIGMSALITLTDNVAAANELMVAIFGKESEQGSPSSPSSSSASAAASSATSSTSSATSAPTSILFLTPTAPTDTGFEEMKAKLKKLRVDLSNAMEELKIKVVESGHVTPGVQGPLRRAIAYYSRKVRFSVQDDWKQWIAKKYDMHGGIARDQQKGVRTRQKLVSWKVRPAVPQNSSGKGAIPPPTTAAAPAALDTADTIYHPSLSELQSVPEHKDKDDATKTPSPLWRDRRRTARVVVRFSALSCYPKSF